MPTYEAGGHRLYVGHGGTACPSTAGPGAATGFTERHPELVTGKGTVRLRPEDAEAIPDEELTAFVRAVLGG